MGGALGMLDRLLDRHTAACAVLALFILTWCGAGNPAIVCLLGLLLCAEGFTQRSAQADLWVLLPLAGYILAGMLSSLAAYGSVAAGFSAAQAVLPVLYLLMACLSREDLDLLKKACAAWTGLTAAASLLQYTFTTAVHGGSARSGGILVNPNAMGIFLVVGWFALLHAGARSAGDRSRRTALLLRLEPLVLAALALTLSRGSCAAMAAGVLWLAVSELRRGAPRQALWPVCRLLARASLGVGSGVLLLLAASRTDAPWLALPALGCILALAACWPAFLRFLEDLPAMAALLAALGLLVAAAAVFLRPSSIATFAERLEMMASAAQYLAARPLVGVGPYRWRLLDLADGGTYFSTWHIHNALLHVGVELGLPAMALLAAAVLRGLLKRNSPGERAGFFAFLVHNLMDTSFFYTGVAALALIAAGEPQAGGRKLSGLPLKLCFGASAAVFAAGLCHALLG